MHELLPWIRMLLFAAFGIAAMTMLVPGISLVRETGAYDWHATGKLTLEEVKLAIGFREFTEIEYRTPDGRTGTMARYAYVTYGPAIWDRERLLALIGDRATLGAAAGFGAALLYLALYGFTGWWRDPPVGPPAHRPPARPVQPAGPGRKVAAGQFATRAAVPANGHAPAPPPANGKSNRAVAAAPPRSETAPRRGNSTPPVPAPAKRGGTRAAAKARPAPTEKTASKPARASSNAGGRKPDGRKAEPDQNFY